ncbi:MAG: hypothetical protein AAF664_14145 [Planctomycetota bacterium]
MIDWSSINGWIAAFVILVFAVSLPGCSSAPKASPELAPSQDTRLKRLAEDGQVEFLQGDLDVAIANYHRAAARAWMLDDPEKTAPMAFNLASCYLDRGDIENASLWNLEARCEYNRAGLSTSNTWLLESKIARSAGDLIRAEEAIATAACASPPCQLPCQEKCDPCDPCQECQQGGFLKDALGCNDERECNEAVEECKIGNQVALEITRAHLTIERGDVNAATAHLKRARCLVKELCRPDLRGEIEHVAALLHDAKGEPHLAATYFDREIVQLRRSGAVRQIPPVLDQAAQAYLHSGRFDLAADRWCRAARVHYGRGEFKLAWRSVTKAASLLPNAMVVSMTEFQLVQESEGTTVAHVTFSELLDSEATHDQTDLQYVVEPPMTGMAADQEVVLQSNGCNEMNARRLMLIAKLIRDALEDCESEAESEPQQ